MNADIFQDYDICIIDEDIVELPWLTKGDSFSENERLVRYASKIPKNMPIGSFDLAGYLINLFTTYKDIGLVDCIAWREALRKYDLSTNTNTHSYENDNLFPHEISNLIESIKIHYDEINASIEAFCIFELCVNGKHGCDIAVLANRENYYHLDKYIDTEINGWSGSCMFFNDLLEDETSLHDLSNNLLEEYWPFND